MSLRTLTRTCCIPPRMRGLSVRLLTENWDLFVFPPHAGVIGRPGAQENWLNSIPPAYGGYRGMSENHCESVVYSPSMWGYRHRNRNGGAFVMCPYKQMGLFTIKESYFPG
ncbi:Uncharacterised protein [Klebsiella pneumoniae]|nr:hypothetical protein B6I39_23610 [Klebsiella quasipneumoniae]PLE65645.1 hypothetical protein B6I76_13485 [Klebsiella pneumoniae]SSF98486.1 Uncharacterised protein [Klebsiella pneumoniae]